MVNFAMIQVENLEFLYISDDETNLIVRFFVRNLVAQANFVEFLDSWNFLFFEAKMSDDIWRSMWMTHGEPCG